MASAEDIFSPAAALAEARALFGLVERGIESVTKVRETIEVTPAAERKIRAAADGDPVLLAPLAFRRAVLKEFDRLARRQEHWCASQVCTSAPNAASGAMPETMLAGRLLANRCDCQNETYECGACGWLADRRSFAEAEAQAPTCLASGKEISTAKSHV